MNILFVCTGNICRSVMSEFFMREYISSSDLRSDVVISSAGLEAEEGERPPAEVVTVMMEYGLDVSDHRAHRLNQTDVEKADLILTMAMHNSSRLLTAHQEAVERVFTLSEFVIQGLKRGSRLKENDPQKRLRELKGWIRYVEGWEPSAGRNNLDEHLRLFFLHYFHIYDHKFTIDDPLGQSIDFMRRTAEEIRESIHQLVGSDILAFVQDKT